MEYVHLYKLQETFRFQGANNRGLREDISDMIFETIARRRAWAEARENGKMFYCIPTLDDAKTMVSDAEFRQGWLAEEGRAFRRFIKDVPLFAGTVDSAPQPISSLAVNYDLKSSGGHGLHPVWDYIEGNFFTISVIEKLDLIQAIKKVLGSPAVPMLHATAQRALWKISANEPMLRQFAPHEGKSIFIRAEDHPDASALRKYAGLRPPKTDACLADVSDPESRGGRPRKQEAAVEAFRDLFPKGRQGFSWKYVLEDLRVKADIEVSEATLRTGLKNAGILE